MGNEFPRRKGIISNCFVKKPLVVGGGDHSCLEDYRFSQKTIRNGLSRDYIEAARKQAGGFRNS